ncbi:MAG: cytochrome c peroxidase [Anaerosomatales bacterium]|nr:cytochrome c peroxidase [Anaerosomatales bacterium]MDT8433803.1 cytochrome c peroxidase [Anaerosomatales bacterium]
MKLQRVALLVFVGVATALLFSLPAWALAADEEYDTPMEMLGDLLFDDITLSTPNGQSCATCHDPDAGYTGPDEEINAAGSVYPGAIKTRFGNRKPPTSAYGGDSPVLYYDADEEVWVGGMFWDGRATGWMLGDPLAEQAMGPFLNPVEQNMPAMKLVVLRVWLSPYRFLFEEVWGPGSLDYQTDVYGSYERIARSIAAYERSRVVNPFDSRFDAFWDATKGGGLDPASIDTGNYESFYGYGLSADEVFGFAVFNDEEKGMCGLCHTLDEGSAGYPLFTDFTYDNLGLPKNPVNPFYTQKKFNPDGFEWIDSGLGGFLQAAGFDADVYEAEWGKHKVPTLRNVDKRPYPEFVKAYGHNGFFKSLEEIVHFYNTRDVEMWPEPEVPDTVNSDELGDLGLTEAEEAAIVTFMKTLSDQ